MPGKSLARPIPPITGFLARSETKFRAAPAALLSVSIFSRESTFVASKSKPAGQDLPYRPLQMLSAHAIFCDPILRCANREIGGCRWRHAMWRAGAVLERTTRVGLTIMELG